VEEICKLKNYRNVLQSPTHTSKITSGDLILAKSPSVDVDSKTISSKRQTVLSRKSLEQLRVLFVDDEPDLVLVIKEGLEHLGFIVDGYTDPFIALSKFKNNLNEVLLLDIKMPGLNGLVLYERLMQIDNRVVVFFLTAYDIYKEALEQLFPNISKHFFIKKPIELGDLVQRLKNGYESLL